MNPRGGGSAPARGSTAPGDPLRFVFGLHLHQPVGNFDHIFRDHVEQVYDPFLRRLAEADFLPVTIHISGPILEWLDRNPNPFLDLVGRLASEGRIELLLAGFYEPVLAAIPREDRLEQIGWMRDHLRARFGVDAETLWLTERVWEPGLAADLVDAGVKTAFVDDRHFRVAGFPAEDLFRPFRTEDAGKHMWLLPIDRKLRYLVPFRTPTETADYLGSLRDRGRPLAVLADDGEKFGGWPGTRRHVYGRDWVGRFTRRMRRMIDRGELELVTPSAAVERIASGGLAYLPTASYHEMERWALPPEAAVRLGQLETDLGAERLEAGDGALVRGSHWKHFMVRYPESNRMHKKMLALSTLSRGRPAGEAVRRHIGRAQCNDAYWHGVFGGVYSPHLRHAIWRELAAAEAALRRGEVLAHEVLDLDGDGHDEIWIHSSSFSAIVAPAQGGALVELVWFERGINVADTLARRLEAYHSEASSVVSGSARDQRRQKSDRVESVHAIESSRASVGRLGLDRDQRALFVERVLPAGTRAAENRRGLAEPLATWAGRPLAYEIQISDDALVVVLRGDRLEKRLRFDAAGAVTARYAWEAAEAWDDALFAVELSLAHGVEPTASPRGRRWSCQIETLGRSERGLERTVQGRSTTILWPIAARSGMIELGEP